MKVKADDNTTIVASYTYGCTNERFILEEGGFRTYYAWSGDTTIAEYVESGSSTIPAWSKSYVYLGEDLLSTLTPNGSGGEAVQYHHSDGLGTRLVTNPSNGTSFEQVTLPFGTALNAESTGATNRRFTSYNRSETTKLDYAVNRHYDPQQGRFTQVDPIGMNASSLSDPQSLNMYTYCGNDPINQTDPDGLFWGRLWRFVKKALVILMAVVLTVVAILAPTPQSISQAFQAWIDVFGGWGKVFPKASKWLKFVPSYIDTSGGAGIQARGTPPWNPDAKGFFVFHWGDEDLDVITVTTRCKRDWPVDHGPKCPGAPWWKKLFGHASDFFFGVFDYGVGPPPILGWTPQRFIRQRLDSLVGVKMANEESWSYYAGSWVPDVVAVAAGGGAMRSLQEITIGGARVAPFGNATNHRLGRFPHYHRRGPRGLNGQPLPGQGIGRHRPFEPSRHDTKWYHRF